MTGLLIALLLFGNPAAASPPDRCVCATARSVNGWCAVHDRGYVGGLTIDSAWLYEALDAHGHDLDLSTFVCPACRGAIAASGFCDEHRIGFVEGKAYFSRLTYELARAEPREPGRLTCAACRTNAESHGWCARCGVGMVGPFGIRSRSDFDRAVRALAIVGIAAEASKRCDHCAGAIVTDTECPFCKIRYEGGRAVRN